MQKRKIIFITFLISTSLIGLVAIQLYWINSAIELKEQEFQNNVYTALQNVVSKLERVEALSHLQKVQKYSPNYLNTDSISHFITSQTEAMVKEFDKFFEYPNNKSDNSITDSVTQKEISNSVKKIITNQHSNITIEIAKDSIPQKPSFLSDYQKNSDTINAQINQWIKKSNLVHEIVRDIATMNMSTNIEERINATQLDTLLKEELNKEHVSTSFQYNIYDPIKQRLLLNNNDNIFNPGELLKTPYRVDLFPNDIFKKPSYLLVYFPNKKQFLLGQMWVLLSVSTAIVLIIIFSFLFVILSLIKQKKLSNIKNDFINNMTHELKTPIATISLACEALSDSDVVKNKSMVDNYISVIDQENKRLAKLVENVLQTAVIEKGEYQLQYYEIDVHTLIAEAIKNMSVQIQKRKGILTTKLEADSSIIHGDKFHLINVLYNLIDNAIKYSNEQLLIEIETRNYAEGIVFSIRDNGIGMSKETQKKIFDKFYRATSGNVHDVKGFGLGLNYVKAIVEMHGGKIELESSPGSGSKFEIYLPFFTNQETINKS